MRESFSHNFNSPEEEIRFLREQIAKQEAALAAASPEALPELKQEAALETLKNYSSFTPQSVLTGERVMAENEVTDFVEQISDTAEKINEVLELAAEKGIRNALSVVEKLEDAYLVDEIHQQLITQIREGFVPGDLREDVPPWHIMNLVLFEIALPHNATQTITLPELVGRMEQLFSGLRTIGAKQANNHYALEIAVADKSDDIVFYVAVPRAFISLFEKQTLGLFPQATIAEQKNDYNIYVDKGFTIISELRLKKHPLYPLRTFDSMQADTMMVLLNAFSKIEREGGGAAIQFLIRHPQKPYHQQYTDIIKDIEKGMKPSEAISRSTFTGSVSAGISDFFFTKKKDTDTEAKVDHKTLEIFKEKMGKDILEVNIRLAVSAKEAVRARQIMSELEAIFNQFSHLEGNEFVFVPQTGGAKKRAEKAFSFREFDNNRRMPLTLTELSTIVHFPQNDQQLVPQLKQAAAHTAPAPNDLPNSGTLLGINHYRGTERMIFSTDDDRIRHFYIIGQTGTGKTTLMKNMITQDILRGDGVCFIDPHGTDIEDILSIIPPEREQDVIYFDPSQLDRPVALNILEFDEKKPEQKTFVVNELFSIFQKLYGGNPESMGPMFEQYFRNATLLVLEDPESGNTLMDISRVMADASYRRYKLERAKNPVVVQFWREIASQAGGEASLQNIVPYIVSKFDVFTANDYIRPIIGQQRSTFNFRQIMDDRKILLVNLSKGRLGEINANLIGMIIVGKILMAALSRVDDSTRSFAPFYLHMDEFQNISTNSISAILSEARKYKLGLTVAHQFIAQLDQSIKEAIFGNVGSMAAFRVGAEDSQFLENQFQPVFNAHDLMNIPNRTAYTKLLMNGVPAQPFSINTMPPAPTDHEKVARLIKQSLQTFGRDREEVEREIRARFIKS